MEAIYLQGLYQQIEPEGFQDGSAITTLHATVGVVSSRPCHHKHMQHLSLIKRQVYSIGSAHLLADVRLRPRPPALVEIIKMKVDGMLLKSSTFFCRWACTGFSI